MDRLSKEGYARLREATVRILTWCRICIVLGIAGMVVSTRMDDVISRVFTLYCGLVVVVLAIIVGCLANITLSDYARDMAWQEKNDTDK